MCAEDKVENDLSVTQGFRILSAYPIEPAKPCKGFCNDCLWIITEADHGVSHLLTAGRILTPRLRAGVASVRGFTIDNLFYQ